MKAYFKQIVLVLVLRSVVMLQLSKEAIIQIVQFDLKTGSVARAQAKFKSHFRGKKAPLR